MQRFCDALRAIGLDWIDVCLDATPDKDADPAPPLEEARAASPDEMRAAVLRAAAASATINCAPWLGVVFFLSWKLEQRWRDDDERPLIGSPLTGMRSETIKDEAWLRTHFCYLSEEALHGARNGGLWAAGNHLVLVAWLSTDRRHADDEQRDHGVRMFARAITAHTVRATDPHVNEARLITPEWQRSIVRSGWDSIVECARRFERELHACTAREAERHAARMQAARARWFEERERAAEEDADGGDFAATAGELPDLPPPAVPLVHARSLDRAHAGAVACGPGRFEKDSIPALDDEPRHGVRFGVTRNRIDRGTADAPILVVEGLGQCLDRPWRELRCLLGLAAPQGNEA